MLQTSLHAERAALAVLRRLPTGRQKLTLREFSEEFVRSPQGSELQITDAVTEAKSLPVRHVRTDVDEVPIALLFAVLRASMGAIKG